MVTLRIDWKSSASGAWNTGNFGTLPESWRPPMDLNFSYGGRDGANQKIINVNANGTMTYANQGGTQGTNAFGDDRLIRAMTRGVTARQCNRLSQCPEAMRRASGRRSSIRRCIPRMRCSGCRA